MKSILTAILLLAAAPALAQGMHHQHGAPGPTAPLPAPSHADAMATPTQPGQSAFAAIQEIVRILEADPSTDWTKVDLEALRQHLIDMARVTLATTVIATPVETGMRFTVTGQGEVAASIQRMVAAHVATMNGADGWTYAEQPVADGATMTVLVPPADIAKLRALGFIGVMTRGMHHQQHHLMIARGDHPH